MGCFDSIIIPCPKCREPYEAQSKSGECLLYSYSLANCPADVMYDVNRHAPFECKCGAIFSVKFTVEEQLVTVKKAVVTSTEIIQHERPKA